MAASNFTMLEKQTLARIITVTNDLVKNVDTMIKSTGKEGRVLNQRAMDEFFENCEEVRVDADIICNLMKNFI